MNEEIQIEEKNTKNHRIMIAIVVLIVFIIVIAYFVYSRTFADYTNPFIKRTFFSTLKLDDGAYGNNAFDTSELDFRPILDKDVNANTKNAVIISFWVGGNKDNNADNPVYDIALQDLNIDCNLLSPYLKWKLYKNGEELSNGSLDYHFDTVKNGRFVLTPIQQDLVPYNDNKSLYDYYQFYLWISDSCQEEDISLCRDKEMQDSLLGKKISGKVEVELYSNMKTELVRTPSDMLDTNTCVNGE